MPVPAMASTCTGEGGSGCGGQDKPALQARDWPAPHLFLEAEAAEVADDADGEAIAAQQADEVVGV